MQQQDYILREIEKIGTVLRAILKKIARKTPFSDESIAYDESYKDDIANLLAINLDTFLSWDNLVALDYLLKQEGFNEQNMELLAQSFFRIGSNAPKSIALNYFNKSLTIFNWCNKNSKAFSIDRQWYISEINQYLSDYPKE